MITAEDVRHHPPADVDHGWAETRFCSAYDVDVGDREHLLTGEPVTRHHWARYRHSYVAFSQIRRNKPCLPASGFGIAQENCPLDQLTGRTFRSGGAA